MRVLIATFAFPPSNVIGAVRVGKLARYLDRSGHDVRVLTTDIVADRSLPLEIPREKVIYSDYRQRKPWAEYIARWLRRPPAAFEDSREGAPARSEASTTSLWSILRRHYLGLVHIPDMRSDWIKTALPAGKRLIKQWQPDIIFASAPPHTGLIVASRLARSFDIAWVADFRDLWVDNPYYNEPVWRKQIDTALERHTLRHVAGLVTVSPTWAEKLSQRHGKSVEVVYNGYAEEDFPPLEPRVPSGEVLTIRYMGSMYPGFRDPSPLFAAIGLLPDHLRNALKVEFFCDTGEVVLEAAAAHRVSDAVSAHRLVPYRRALELQTEADVLLLLQSSNERDEGNLPAKLFEYLYVRRPILLIGYERGVAAQLVETRGAGFVSSDPTQIRDQLQRWSDDKRAGRLNRLDPSVCEGLSRDEQYQKLEQLFGEIVRAERRHDGRQRRRDAPPDSPLSHETAAH